MTFTSTLSHDHGLSTKEAIKRQKQFGLNVLPEKPPPGNVMLIIQQLKNPLVYVLLGAGIATTVIGHIPDTLIIFFAVFINTILGFVQEKKASNALQALKHYVSHRIIVIRNGSRIVMETSRIVPGDTVLLHQGTKIPADGTITHANRLYLDEALLTGESTSVKKSVKDEVYMGTTVSAGQGVMHVQKIGAQTKMGVIALKIQKKEEDTPFQKQLKTFSKQLVRVMGVLIAIVFIAGVFHQFTFMEMFITSVALAVSSIPEGLIVSLTVVLAIGMQKILKRRGLVRKLAAAETLGGVTVICVDKTGTLTKGSMKVVDVMGNEHELAEQVLLANDLDDPIVISAFEWGRSIIHDFVSKHPRLDSIPFSSKERFFISLHSWSKKENRIYVNGAPDLLLHWTTLPQEKKAEIQESIDNLTKQGKRLIGFARKNTSPKQTHLEHDDAKNSLEWVGMLAFNDPVREGVKEALEKASEAFIRTIVITGDYPKTSAFVLSQLGMPVSHEEIMTGDELEKISEKDFTRKIQAIRLFARTTPDQKLKIVRAFKERGEVVAMMGDGVNDAPALHEADIGIAVGEATDVAKESADLILLDSNFATIIHAIEEGRGMFENMRKILLYLLCDAFMEIIIILGSIMAGLPLPITAIQILWVNLISDGFPDMALAVDPKRKGIMEEKPRRPGEPLVNKWMTFLVAAVSITTGILTLISFYVIYAHTYDVLLARSVAFVMIGIDSLVYVFSVRTLMTPFWKQNFLGNIWLLVAVAAGAGLQILPFSTLALRKLFGLRSLTFDYWLLAFTLAVFIFFLIEFMKILYHYRKNR